MSDQSPNESNSQPSPPDSEISETLAIVAPAPESTVGTGTAMALGCIVGTILLIGFGLIFLFFAAMR